MYYPGTVCSYIPLLSPFFKMSFKMSPFYYPWSSSSKAARRRGRSGEGGKRARAVPGGGGRQAGGRRAAGGGGRERGRTDESKIERYSRFAILFRNLNCVARVSYSMPYSTVLYASKIIKLESSRLTSRPRPRPRRTARFIFGPPAPHAQVQYSIRRPRRRPRIVLSTVPTVQYCILESMTDSKEVST